MKKTMVAKVVATPCLQWYPTTLVSKKQAINDGILACRSMWVGTMSSKLYRSQTFHFGAKQRTTCHSTIRRACSASFDNLYDEEFFKKIQDLALRFELSNEEEDDEKVEAFEALSSSHDVVRLSSNSEANEPSSMEAWWVEIHQEPPDWTMSIEMKANNVNIPHSLRMIKQKKKLWKEGFREAGESAYCSVKKAFSSMVFIIRELHSYTLQMRELLFYEDLQGIVGRVQKEMHASFVWLFQQVFSHTPILMVHVMILLANFTVHSMSTSAAITVIPRPIVVVEEREISTTSSSSSTTTPNIKCFGGGKTTSIGGSNGGGCNTRSVANGTGGDDEGWVSWSADVLPDIVSPLWTKGEQSVSGLEEIHLRNSIVQEGSKMQAEVSGEGLDHETLHKFISPVTAKLDADIEYQDYFPTELLYQMGLTQDPNNVLLLSNYAQFLYLVAHDYDRAEEYFKKAIAVEPKDAEAHNKYAHFLWQVKKDLWAAEETFLEAISADPTNSYYAANYAHFLWNTGGEDTCFPLNQETLDEP